MTQQPTSKKIIHWTFWPEFEEITGSTGAGNKHYGFLFMILFIFGLIINLLFINNQLWQDELFTLENFVLVPISKTAGDYSSTNNHIVFNLLTNLYLKIINADDLHYLLNNPAVVRVVPLFFTLLSIPLFYFSLKKITPNFFALTVLTILISSIQFYSFGTQVRGYSLNIFLVSLMLSLILNYQRKQKRLTLFLIFVSGTLSLINLPSTIYFYLSVILIQTINMFYKNGNKKPSLLFKSADFKLTQSLCFAFIIFALFFWFKKDQIIANPLLSESGNKPSQLIRQPASVLYSFFGIRYFLLIPFIFIPFYKKKSGRPSVSLFLAGSLLMPFLLFALHNPVIVLRIWVVLLPVFCLLVAQFISPYLQVIRNGLPYFVLISLLTVCFSLYLLRNNSIRNHYSNFTPLDLKNQYHFFDFFPNKIVQKAKQNIETNNAGILLYDQSISGIQYYLKYNDIAISDSLTSTHDYYFLITDNSRSVNEIGGHAFTIKDSSDNDGHNFFKWYLLKSNYD